MAGKVCEECGEEGRQEGVLRIAQCCIDATNNLAAGRQVCFLCVLYVKFFKLDH